MTADWSVGVGAGRPKPPERARHQTYELAPPPPSLLRPLPLKAPCAEIQAAALAMLGLLDEKDVASGLPELETRVSDPACRLGYLLEPTRPRLSSTYTLYAGDRLVIAIDKLDPSSRAVIRTWHVVVTGQPPASHWPYENEEAWIRGEVSRNICEQVFLAGNGSELGPLSFALSRDEASGAHRVSARIGSVPLDHVLARGEHAWSPAGYEGLAAVLMERMPPRGRRGGRGVPALETLLNPLPRLLRAEDRRVSERLLREWRSPDAHLDAVFLLGALALREPPGEFSDVRATLNRITAHLAIARVLGRGSKPSPRAAELAEALLDTLVGRQRAALEGLERTEKTRLTAPEQSWLRVLRMSNNGDWRLLAEPQRASLLERLTYYRALLQRVGSDRALAFAADADPPTLPDWGLLALALGGTVSVGNTFADPAFDAMREEASLAWKELGGGRLPGGPFIEALNERPGGTVTRRVGGGRPCSR